MSNVWLKSTIWR